MATNAHVRMNINDTMARILTGVVPEQEKSQTWVGLKAFLGDQTSEQSTSQPFCS
jgi:hypothetical protein